MKKAVISTLIKLFLVISLVVAAQTLMADESVTITGNVNEFFQIVTDDGEVYNIGDTDKGAELDNMAGKRIEALGTVINSEGELVIMISDYQEVESN